MNVTRASLATALLSAMICSGCARQRRTDPQSRSSVPPAARPVTFADVTDRAGLYFKHTNGADGRFRFPEAEPPGCVFFDMDNDGAPDIFIANGRSWPDSKGRVARTTPALYRNRGDGTFEDVTHQFGLDVEMFAMGAAAGDFDNDGREDLFVTCVDGLCHLFHNEGGRFRDVTTAAGVGNGGRWATAALWIDYDNDGFLDLFVGNYCKWSLSEDRPCTPFGSPSYCTPAQYKGEACRLYHNRGNGTFEDVSERAGLNGLAGKTLGASLLDYDGDGRPDIVLANDLEPTTLLRNNGNGTFTDVAVEAGIALADTAKPRSGMGVDAADVDGSGRESVVVSNFTGEGLSFFRNVDGQAFQDVSAATGLAATSLNRMGWGLCFFDFDLDGRKDIFVANGHLYPDVADHVPNMTYAQPGLLYHNLGDWRFEEVSGTAGDVARPVVGRGACVADIDRDGDPDILVATNGGRLLLLRNDGGNAHAWLRVKLVGTKSNRDAIGARVDVEAGGLKQMFRVRSGSSYMSDSEKTLTIGLNDAEKVNALTIRWPSGAVERYSGIAARALLVATEGRDARAYPRQDLAATPAVYSPTPGSPVSSGRSAQRGAPAALGAATGPHARQWTNTGGSVVLASYSWPHGGSAGDDANSVREKGARALKAGRYEEAARLLASAARSRPNDSELLVLAGFASLRAHRLADAKRFVGQAIRLAPSAPSPYLLLARVRAADGDHKGAIRAANDYLSRSTEPSAGLFLLGALYFQWADYPSAENWLRRSARANPSNPEVWLMLGQIARVLRPSAAEEARAYYERSLALNPDYGDAHAALGRLLTERRDWQGAIAHLQLALKTASDPGAVYYSLGQALSRAGRKEEAKEAFARYRKLQEARKSTRNPAAPEAGRSHGL